MNRKQCRTMEYQYRIRPHHGMCMAFFRGEGYSGAFTAHMGEVIQSLKSNPSVRISAQTDEICLKCPNNRQGVCESEHKVMEYDRRVLEQCGISDGTVMPYADFKMAVYENILRPGKREGICGNCRWNGLCR